MDRASKQSGAAVINAMCDAVDGAEARRDRSTPEGTTFSGRTRCAPSAPSAFLAAERTGAAEIVPVGIAYEGDAASFLDESFVTHLPPRQL